MSDFYDDEIELEEELLDEEEENFLEDLEPAEKEEGEEHKEGDKESEYEDVCFICRRPESKTGKMFKLPNNICVCDDCMHKTMETVSQFDYQGMLNDPAFKQDMDQMMKGGFPNIRFVNMWYRKSHGIKQHAHV